MFIYVRHYTQWLALRSLVKPYKENVKQFLLLSDDERGLESLSKVVNWRLQPKCVSMETRGDLWCTVQNWFKCKHFVSTIMRNSGMEFSYVWF